MTRLPYTPQEGLEASWGHFLHHGRLTLRAAALIVKYAAVSVLWTLAVRLFYSHPKP